MMPSTETVSYTRTAILLHWLIALAIFVMLALGWGFDFFQGTTKFFLIQLHKSIGITILLLSLARLGWRMTHKAPPLPSDMPRWEQKAAHVGHCLLYIAMIGLPLSGWALVSASPRNVPTILFGLVPWPHLPVLATLENKKAAAEFLGNVHGLSATLLALLIVGHAFAALRHHFIVRDDVLLRMLPRPCIGFLNRMRGQA
jgi:cytochrome b561